MSAPAGTPPVSPRDDVALMEGYHSPQLDVKVRLNTNESPEPPPPAGVRRATGRRAAATSSGTATRTGPPRSCAPRIAELHGVDPEQVFAANGSNEVLQTVCLTYGGHGRTAAVFEPTYALHATSPGSPAPRWSRASRNDDFAADLDEVDRVLAEAPPDDHLPVLAQQPHRVGRRAPTVRRTLALADSRRGLVVVDEAYGQFAPWSALELVGDDVPLVVTRTFSKTWSMAAARLGYLVGPPWLVAELDKVVLPYHLDAFKQAGGPARPRLPARDGCAGRRARRGAGTADGRARRAPPSTCGRRAPTSCCSDPATPTATRCGRRCSIGPSSSATAPSWPRLEGCLRVTVGTTDEDDALLAALAGGADMTRAVASARRTCATTTRPRSSSISTSTGGGHGRGQHRACRSSTTCSTSWASRRVRPQGARHR